MRKEGIGVSQMYGRKMMGISSLQHIVYMVEGNMKQKLQNEERKAGWRVILDEMKSYD